MKKSCVLSELADGSVAILQGICDVATKCNIYETPPMTLHMNLKLIPILSCQVIRMELTSGVIRSAIVCFAIL